MILKIIFKGSLVRVNTAGHQDPRIPPRRTQRSQEKGPALPGPSY